mmetsp:Transcript_90584/g.161333  ORF Transcript_90584/g.161333 Transcript_90584/m.161333 type:complete len:337 (+) Transcript_90584:83-1093(+)
MGNMLNVPKVEMCCTAADTDVPEDMISPDLAQALFMHEVPVHVNATMEDEIGQAVASLKAERRKKENGQEEHAVRRQLLAAVQQDDAPAVLQFVADGVNSVDMGEAMRLAAGRGSSSVVRELVAVGLSVNEGVEGSGFTPLQLAAAGGHVVVCELLLDALADVHRQVDGITALSLARKMGNVEVEEVIERHVAALLMQDQGNAADETAQYRRAHVLPRVSAVLSEAVLQAGPLDDSVKEDVSYAEEVDSEIISNNAQNLLVEATRANVSEEAPGAADAASNAEAEEVGTALGGGTSAEEESQTKLEMRGDLKKELFFSSSSQPETKLEEESEMQPL